MFSKLTRPVGTEGAGAGVPGMPGMPGVPGVPEVSVKENSDLTRRGLSRSPICMAFV